MEGGRPPTPFYTEPETKKGIKGKYKEETEMKGRLRAAKQEEEEERMANLLRDKEEQEMTGQGEAPTPMEGVVSTELKMSKPQQQLLSGMENQPQVMTQWLPPPPPPTKPYTFKKGKKKETKSRKGKKKEKKETEKGLGLGLGGMGGAGGSAAGGWSSQAQSAARVESLAPELNRANLPAVKEEEAAEDFFDDPRFQEEAGDIAGLDPFLDPALEMKGDISVDPLAKQYRYKKQMRLQELKRMARQPGAMGSRDERMNVGQGAYTGYYGPYATPSLDDTSLILQSAYRSKTGNPSSLWKSTRTKAGKVAQRAKYFKWSGKNQRWSILNREARMRYSARGRKGYTSLGIREGTTFDDYHKAVQAAIAARKHNLKMAERGNRLAVNAAYGDHVGQKRM
jgi:hypothetical protein